MLNAAHLDIFEQAVKILIETMASTPVTVEKRWAKEDHDLVGEIAGIIGLVGETLNGTMVLSFERASIFHIFSNMLGEEIDEVNTAVMDAVGELTNIVCGTAKQKFSEKHVAIGMATPIVICGDNLRMRDRPNRITYGISFMTSAGRIVLETNVSE